MRRSPNASPTCAAAMAAGTGRRTDGRYALAPANEFSVVEVAATQALPTYGANVGAWHVDVTATNKVRSPITVKS